MPHLDTQEFGCCCLGVHWQRLTEARRREFIELFQRLIEKSYGGMLDCYAQGIRVTYQGERVEDGFAEVDTRIFSEVREQPFAVTCRLRHVAGKWLFYDVVVENISMVSNYRNQFNRIISRSSYEELVAAIKRKLAQLEAAPEDMVPALSSFPLSVARAVSTGGGTRGSGELFLAAEKDGVFPRLRSEPR